MRQRSRGRQEPKSQRSSDGQSASTWQFCGGGITQNPARQTSLGGHWVELVHPPGFRHTWVMHLSGMGHCESSMHKRERKQTPPMHWNPALQSLLEEQENG